MTRKHTATTQRTLGRPAALWLVVLALGCAATGPYTIPHDFEDRDDRTVFQFEERGEGVVAVVSDTGATLYQVTTDGAGVRIEGAHEEALGRVVPLPGGRGYEVRDATGRELYKLILEADGDFKLRHGDGRTLYVGKARSYGFKVLNENEEVESRVKIRSGRVSIRDQDDQKYMSAKIENPSHLAVAVLTLQDIPLSYVAGLSVAITHDHFAPEGAPES